MTHLSLSLLGPFQATLAGQPITNFRANKVRALLAYLALEAGRPHPRTVLAGLLWPDRTERAALASLRNALAILRVAIGDRDATPPFLQITRETIKFNPASDIWLDVAAFQALVETAETDRPAYERLEQAVALYRGDLLHGFAVRGCPDFEDWALLLRERLHRQVLAALRRLIAQHVDHREVGRACDVAWRYVELAPWEEEAHQQLMTLLALSGQRGAALAQYEACRRALAEELGVEPGEETVALYERIRAGEVELPVASPSRELATASRSLPFLEREAEGEKHARSAFVARERELECLGGFLEAALPGQGRVVFITGEAGTGKTALAGEFARRAQARHADLVVAAGNCNAYTGAGDAYLPFREVLGQLTGDVEPRWRAGVLSTEGARRLWRAVPLAVQSLVEVGPGLIGTLLAAQALAARAAMAASDGAVWRDRLETQLARDEVGRGRVDVRQADLYAQVTSFLSALAQRHPLLLVLDDLQWADADSIGLLFHLGRRLAGSRILIAGIYRPSEVALGRNGDRHPLTTAVREFERQFGPIEVKLPQAGDRQFVTAFLDSEPNRLGLRFREALYQHTGGHALCTVEMLRDMQERGDLVQDETGRWVEGSAVDWASLPARVEGAIGERIDRLPAALRETLKVASVEGEVFTAEVVAQVRGRAEYELVTELSGELGRRHRLVVSEGSQRLHASGGRASRYRFRHILFQKHVYDDLDGAERAYLHEAVGDALERVHAGQVETIAVQLARHYHAAARMGKAVDYFVLAGDGARGLYAYAEARQHYARALDALARLPDTEGNRRKRVDALIARTACSSRADSPEHNLARLTEAERLAQELPGPDGRPGGDHLRLARVHFGMGSAHLMGSAYPECIRYYQRALSAARASGNDELIALCSASTCRALGLQGHNGKAKALADQAIPLLEQIDNGSEWFSTMGHYGVILAFMGDYTGGLAAIHRARAWAQERNALTEVFQSSFFLNAAHILGGDLPRALEASGQLAELAEWLGDRVYIYVGLYHQCWAASRAGQYDAAAACVAKAHAMVRELGERIVHVDHLAALNAEIAFATGRVQEAIALAEQAVGIAQETGGIFAESMARRTWGQALAALEPPQWTEAGVQLAHSLRLQEQGQSWLEAARTHEAWGAVCRDRGDLAAARAHWAKAAAQWETSGLAHELARTRGLIEGLVSS